MLEIIAAPAMALGFGLFAVYWSQRRFRLAGLAAASACRMRVEQTSNFWSAGQIFRASDGPVQLRIQGPQRHLSTPRRRAYPANVVVEAPWPQGFTGVRIRPEVEKPRRAREIEIGDEAFDQAFYIVGPTRLLFALLDAQTRHQMILANAENTFEISRGALQVGVHLRQITATVRLLLDLARRFSQPLNIPQRLAENSRLDTNPGVRLKNLLLLASEFPGEPGTTEALRVGCVDESPMIRLRAAQKLGAEGRDVLEKLAQSTEIDTISAQAIASLGRELPLERIRTILVHALGRRLLQTAHACLAALGGSSAAEDVDALAKVLARENNELAAAAAEALGKTGSPAAEEPLLLALQHEQPEARVAAAQALGRAGTVAAVLPLKEAAEQTSDRELRSATRQSIAEIQSRLQGAAPGQLTLTGDEGGQLSLAEAEEGELSLTEDPGGQLSLPAEGSGV
jgi:hypothetical protein